MEEEQHRVAAAAHAPPGESRPVGLAAGGRRYATDALALVLRVVLGCTFLLSSFPKLRQPYDFLSSVYEYELVGPRLGMAVAMALPWLEVFLGVCLIGGVFLGGAFLTSAVLTAVFCGAQVSALTRGLDISCGCFAASGTDVVSVVTIARTALLCGAAGIGYAVAVGTPKAPTGDRQGCAGDDTGAAGDAVHGDPAILGG